MGMTMKGSAELQADFLRLVGIVDKQAEKILSDGAQPILEQMKQNATIDPKRRTGHLHDALSIKVSKTKATIGVHREDTASSDVAKYAYAVEYGHAGPHPAPPHPYVRPAFDARADEAYQIIRDELKNALK